MSRSRIGLLVLVAGLWSAPSSAQNGSQCLHAGNETQVQQQRREDAVDSAELINRIIKRRPRGSAYPTWEELAKSPAVAQYRSISGRQGDLARKIQWGAEQPLSGWLIHYVAAEAGYALSLTDMRDPCQFTVATNDTGLVIEGRPASLRGEMRVVPLDSSQ